MNDHDETSLSPRVFWSCAAVGLALVAYGAGLFVESGHIHPDQWIRRFAGALIVHDVVVPLVIVA